MKKKFLLSALLLSFGVNAGWQVDVGHDAFTGKPQYKAYSQKAYAALVCNKGNVSVMSLYDGYLSKGKQSRMEWVVDDEIRGVDLVWTKNRNAFWLSPSSRLLESMKKGNVMKTRVSDYDDGLKTNEFELAGFTVAYDWMVKKCQDLSK